MKKSFIVLWVIIIVAFAGCSKSGTKTALFDCPEHRFTVSIPADWTKRDDTKEKKAIAKEVGMLLYISAPTELKQESKPEDDAVFSIISKEFKSQEEANNWLKENIIEAIPIKELSNLSYMDVNGKKVTKYIKNMNNKAMVANYFVINDKDLLLFTGAAKPELYSKYEGQFDSIVKSLKFK